MELLFCQFTLLHNIASIYITLRNLLFYIEESQNEFLKFVQIFRYLSVSHQATIFCIESKYPYIVHEYRVHVTIPKK